jgi:hypothetical protein
LKYNPIDLPLETLILKLEAEGFKIGVDTRIRLLKVLKELGKNFANRPQDLKQIICPLIAKNGVEQERFKKIFDSYYSEVWKEANSLLEKIKKKEKKTEYQEKTRMKGASWEMKNPEMWYSRIVFGIIAVIILVLFAFHSKQEFIIPEVIFEILSQKDKTIELKNKTEKIDGLKFIWSFGDGSNLKSNDTIVTYTYDKPGKYEVYLMAYFSKYSSKYSESKEVTIKGPIVPIHHSTKDEGEPYFIRIIRIGICLFSLLFWLDIFLESAKILIIDLKIEKYSARLKPPYFLSFPPQYRSIEISNNVYDLARLMRHRCAGDIYRLDIPKTITATTHAVGFPVLKFKQSSRPSEYLVLIDKKGIHNQQAALFEQLIDSLKNEDVYIDKFFYHTDPRICWNKEFTDGLTLQQLHEKYPKHRLVVFGDGAYMVNPFEVKLINGVESSFKKWKERVIFTPVAFADWGYKEYLLNAELFIVLPADTAGLLELVEAITSPEKPDFKNLKKIFASNSQKSSLGLDFENINDLKEYFKKEDHLFDWLCALAYFPRPYWELTLAIGKKLEGYFKDKKLVYYANLLKLTRIKWLQTGDIPDEIREKLLNELKEKPEIHELVDLTILEVLKKIEVPRDSLAYEEIEIFIKTKSKFKKRSKWIDYFYNFGAIIGFLQILLLVLSQKLWVILKTLLRQKSDSSAA